MRISKQIDLQKQNQLYEKPCRVRASELCCPGAFCVSSEVFVAELLFSKESDENERARIMFWKMF